MVEDSCLSLHGDTNTWSLMIRYPRERQGEKSRPGTGTQGGPEEAVGSQGPEMRVGALVRAPCHPPQNVKGSSSWQYRVLSFDGM